MFINNEITRKHQIDVSTPNFAPPFARLSAPSHPPTQKHLDAASLGLMASDDADADVTGRLPSIAVRHSGTAIFPLSVPRPDFNYGVSRSAAATSRNSLFICLFLSEPLLLSLSSCLSPALLLLRLPSSSQRLLTHRSDLTLHHTQRRCRGAESTSPPADSPCMDAQRKGML